MIFWWAAATTLISFSAFIINERVDGKDTDLKSWNALHTHAKDFSPVAVNIMFIACSVGGIALSWRLGLLAWGSAIYAIGVLYSWPPIRLKAHFAFDIVGQMFACWVLPFGAIVWRYGLLNAEAWHFIFAFICMTWCIFYPYQLADLPADQAAGLRNTHTVLGLRRSMFLGMCLGIVGLVVGAGWVSRQPWTIAIFIMTIYSIGRYLSWLFLPETKIIPSMRGYVIFLKPYTQLLVPFLLIWVMASLG